MSVQGYVSSYGFDLAKLKLVNGACNQEWKFNFIYFNNSPVLNKFDGLEFILLSKLKN